MTTICSGCRKSITEYEKEGKDFVLCKKCSRFTPKNNVKAGGKLLMAKKRKREGKITKKKLFRFITRSTSKLLFLTFPFIGVSSIFLYLFLTYGTS